MTYGGHIYKCLRSQIQILSLLNSLVCWLTWFDFRCFCRSCRGSGFGEGTFSSEFLNSEKKHDLSTKNNRETKVKAETNPSNGSTRR